LTNTKLSLVKKITNQIVETRDRRSQKGMVVAMSCEIVKIDERGTYKVQSETDVSKFYTVKFMDGCPVYCDCPDFLNKIKANSNHICKHQLATVFGENYGLVTKKSVESKSFKDDEYSF
jgi:predicted nucleic acid-binding Zn finger protein